MSAVTVSLHKVTSVTAQGTSAPVPSCTPYGTPETITSTGSSAASTQAGPAAAAEWPLYVWRIANMGTDNVHVTFASSPTATTAHPGVPAGAIAFFGVDGASQKVAVINAA